MAVRRVFIDDDSTDDGIESQISNRSSAAAAASAY